MIEPTHEERKKPDWRLTGINIRYYRSIQSITQVGLAKAAGVSPTTIVSLEKGRPVRPRTLASICQALNVHPSELAVHRALNVKSSGRSYVLHRPQNLEWSAYADLRRKIPNDNVALIQKPEERRRLGRLGLVPVFGTAPCFEMPEGPSILIDEIYQPFRYSTEVYRDYVLHVTSGAVRITLTPGGVLVLNQGDMLGVSDDVQIVVAPFSPVGPDDEPPLLMWVCANRKGRL